MAAIAAGDNNTQNVYSIVNRPEIPTLLPTMSLSTPPDVFGSYYVGSTKWRHNQIKRKQRAKRK